MTNLFKDRLSILQAIDASLTPYSRTILGMYNSRIQGIITDPSLMSISIDDHMVHRGHSVFDTVSIIEGQAYNLKRHLRRLLFSAEIAKISLPMPIETIEKSLLDLASSTGQKNLYIRYWLSAGPGSMSVWPEPNQSTFYAMAYFSDIKNRYKPVNEATVTIPIKQRYLTIMKSTNYLVNALCAMEGREKGGHYGLQVDENGFIAEGSVNNVCFILPNNSFVTPKFDKILNGTTIERIMFFAEKLRENGELTSVEQRDIHIDEAKTAIEMMEVGGDVANAVLNWDGVPINNGIEGKFAQAFKAMMLLDYQNTELLVPVDYSIYE